MKVGATGSSGSKRRGKALDLTELDDASWAALKFQAEVFDGLITSKRTRAAVENAAKLLSCHPASVYRKLGRYRQERHLLVFVRNLSSGGKGKSRLTPEQDEIIATTLKRFLRKRRGDPVTEFVKEVVAACGTAVPVPSPRSIRRRFEALTERERTAHRLGRAKAAEVHNLERGGTPECSRPLERVQVDHTRGDIWLVSEDGGTKLGRPWVTLVIDEFSRCVLAIHISYKAPSSIQFAAAASLAVLPKRDWLEENGLPHIEWPYHGVPGVIYSDGGPDLTAHAAWRGLEKWGGRWELRERPHYGGIVESLIGTAMKRARLLKGNTRFSKADKREDRIDPSRTASMTPRQFLKELIQFFGEEYHHRPHPALGMTPHDKWHLGCHQHGEPSKVSDPHRFYLDFLPSKPRTVQKYGVMLSHLRYRAPELQKLLNHAKGMEVLVKPDPADVTRAFVEDPLSGDYVEVRSAPLLTPNVTRDEWEHHRRLVLDAKPNGQIGQRAIEFSIMTGRLLEKEAEFQGAVAPGKGKRRRMTIGDRAAARRRENERQAQAISAARLPPPVIAAVPDPPRPTTSPRVLTLFEIRRSVP